MKKNLVLIKVFMLALVVMGVAPSAAAAPEAIFGWNAHVDDIVFAAAPGGAPSTVGFEIGYNKGNTIDKFTITETGEYTHSITEGDGDTLKVVIKETNDKLKNANGILIKKNEFTVRRLIYNGERVDIDKKILKVRIRMGIDGKKDEIVQRLVRKANGRELVRMEYNVKKDQTKVFEDDELVATINHYYPLYVTTSNGKIKWAGII
ncbi:MAG: hypothetical protein V1776_03285 [Candidatus Diapherotrites archaeon]